MCQKCKRYACFCELDETLMRAGERLIVNEFMRRFIAVPDARRVGK
jgi:hypothetical protein